MAFGLPGVVRLLPSRIVPVTLIGEDSVSPYGTAATKRRIARPSLTFSPGREEGIRWLAMLGRIELHGRCAGPNGTGKFP